MKFVFADSQDFIDPLFNFEQESYAPDRRIQHDDQYPHEFFPKAPYDGMLVSRAIVGDEHYRGKYTTAQSFRFRRDGARAFLRYNPAPGQGMLMGDCGAFSYFKLHAPPFAVEDMVDYYAECQFTHGVSIDHVILDYDPSIDAVGTDSSQVPAEYKHRFELTLQLGQRFLERTIRQDAPFLPVGVTQGWSPKSYAAGAKRLAKMGYEYIAIGGMAQRRVPEIKDVLEAVREVVPMRVPLHIFGFTKADDIEQFVDFGIGSFDSTSPMLRSFRDGRRNYYVNDRWYTALRVPHADESPKFKKEILSGAKSQRELRQKERVALDAVRAVGAGGGDVEATLRALSDYATDFGGETPSSDYRRTLEERPWEDCSCRVCSEIGIEVLLFRGSNRNRRRGFHNLWTFHQKLSRIRPAQEALA